MFDPHHLGLEPGYLELPPGLEATWRTVGLDQLQLTKQLHRDQFLQLATTSSSRGSLAMLAKLVPRLHFQPGVLARARRLLARVARRRRPKPETYVGLHVMGHLGLEDVQFFQEATSKLRSTYPGAVFLAVGDSPALVKEHLVPVIADLVVAGDLGGGQDLGEDLAVVSLCDHVVVRGGEVARWAALLAGGSVTYPRYIQVTKVLGDTSR